MTALTVVDGGWRVMGNLLFNSTREVRNPETRSGAPPTSTNLQLFNIVGVGFYDTGQVLAGLGARGRSTNTS